MRNLPIRDGLPSQMRVFLSDHTTKFDISLVYRGLACEDYWQSGGYRFN